MAPMMLEVIRRDGRVAFVIPYYPPRSRTIMFAEQWKSLDPALLVTKYRHDAHG
jgi:hypothetical protein